MAKNGISQRYSFTVTLKPRLFMYPAERQYDDSAEALCDHLNKLAHSYTLVAELTKNFNIHYHGTIVFPMGPKNLKKHFVDSFRKNVIFGFVSIKDITMEPGWMEYIKKELKTTNETIGRRPILHDGLTYFPIGEFELYGIQP